MDIDRLLDHQGRQSVRGHSGPAGSGAADGHQDEAGVVNPAVDYRAVFKALVAPLLVMTPDFVIVAASDSYLEVSGRDQADLLGRHFFTVFPGNPSAPGGEGPECLRASLERVLATGERDTMALKRYDMEASDRPGVFEERYWNTINTPVLGPEGEVELIIHRTEEVTDFLQQLGRSGVTGMRAGVGDDERRRLHSRPRTPGPQRTTQAHHVGCRRPSSGSGGSSSTPPTTCATRSPGC